jgi:glycosyltransferase involved in cell wall biosynthesis
MPAPLIAIDAAAVPARPAGAGRYTLSLIEALLRVDLRHDYVVYARHHCIEALQGLGERFNLVDVGALARGRRERARGFTWDACAEATLAVYRKVLNEA